MSKTVLVVVAHPDDEILGCGGTMARHVKEYDNVFCLILGEGITSRGADDNKVIELKEQAREAAKIIGSKVGFAQNFPDQMFDTIPLLKIIKAIEVVRDEIKPDIVYTHHQGDLNLDHQITFKAVLTACRPLKGETVKEIYSFEVPSSTEWNAPQSQNYFMPNVFIDISDTLDKKIESLKVYKDEIRDFPHPRSAENLRAIATRWGSIVGCQSAEAFVLIRKIIPEQGKMTCYT